MEPQELKAIVEAFLFIHGGPLAMRKIAEVFGGAVSVTELNAAVAALKADCDAPGRGVELIEVAGGLQLVTHRSLEAWVRKLGSGQRTERLTHPSLETLAIVAYRQPVTRAQIEAIRGVNVEGVLQTLLERNVIRIVGRGEGVGRPLVYGTTPEFLCHFGLRSLDDLPPLGSVLPAPEAVAPVPATPAEVPE